MSSSDSENVDNPEVPESSRASRKLMFYGSRKTSTPRVFAKRKRDEEERDEEEEDEIRSDFDDSDKDPDFVVEEGDSVASVSTLESPGVGRQVQSSGVIASTSSAILESTPPASVPRVPHESGGSSVGGRG